MAHADPADKLIALERDFTGGYDEYMRQRDALIHVSLRVGHNCKWVAGVVGLSVGRVSNIGKSGREAYRHWRHNEIERLGRLGWHYKAIATKLDVSPSLVYTVWQRRGVPTKKRPQL